MHLRRNPDSCVRVCVCVCVCSFFLRITHFVYDEQGFIRREGRLMNLSCLGSQAAQILAKNIFISIYISEDVRAVAWQQRNKAKMTLDNRIVAT